MRARWLCACLVTALIGVVVPTGAQAASGDAAATQAYLRANYTLVSYFAAHIPSARAQLAGVLAGVRRECPQAAAQSPEDVDSEQLSNEVIGTMVTTVAQRNLPPTRSFDRTVASLRWSNGALTSAVRAYVAKGTTLTALAVPHLCADIEAWVAGDYQTLPQSTVAFDRRFMPSWVAPGFLPHALAAYETPQERTLARRTVRLEEKWTEFEAYEVETWGEIMNALVLQP
ncbi:MAG: hypothetical protein ACRDJX_09195 [Solirubrobacteraceae bacterium]